MNELGKTRNQKGMNLVSVIMAMLIMMTLIFGAAIFGAKMVEESKNDSTTQQEAEPAKTPPPAAVNTTIDFTIPVTILVLGGVAFVSYKVVLPIVRTRRATAIALRDETLRRAESWKLLRGRKDSLMLSWSKYETDVALMIDYPIMTDYTDPVVSKVIAAMQKIRTAEMNVKEETTDAQGSDLMTALDEFEVAFHTAENYARKVGQTKLDPREQRKLETARTALNIILDGDAPAHEVEAAYKSLRSSLKGIIDIPQVAVAALESRVRKELVAA